MKKQQFSYLIINWYRKNKRDLPFRLNKDPYSIWVSEIMAQQTKIDTMIPYYNNWMKEFPDVYTLAAASLEEILKAWEGLGYYRRVRMMHAASKEIVNKYQGNFPHDINLIKTIKGIGDYTAAAIASIAFNQKEPAVDGNVLRVMTRFFADESDISKNKTKKDIKKKLYDLMGDDDFGDFTQGLMELGALICTIKKPLCDSCPLQADCLAYQRNMQNNLPINLQQKRVIEIDFNTYIIIDNGKLLISKDWSDGLMEGYYRLPQNNKQLDITMEGLSFLGKSKHVYSHRIWRMDIYSGSKLPKSELWKNDLFWEDVNKAYQLIWISAHRKIIEKFILI